MKTSYLEVVKSLSPEISYPNFNSFMDNLKSQEMEWYATFRNHITDKIEAYDFDELNEEGVISLMPVTTLAAMNIMKEGFGWADAQLINECKNDVRVRHALGINQVEDVPTESMMSKFTALLSTFQKHTGINLMSELIEKITEEEGPVMKLGEGRIMLWAMRVA